MRYKIFILSITLLMSNNLLSEEIDYQKIYDELPENINIDIQYFKYSVSGSINIYENPSSDSSFISVDTNKIYTIQRYEETYWYLCRTEEDEKGYIDLSSVNFNDEKYRFYEERLLDKYDRFQRFGPLLVYKSEDDIIVFEDEKYWEDSLTYTLEAVEMNYFVIAESTFESSIIMLVNYNDIKNPVFASSIPIINEEKSIIYSCGRSFYPPDLLMIFDLNNELNLMYSAWVSVDGLPRFPSMPRLSLNDNSINIKYEEKENIIVPLDSDGIPQSSPLLDIKPPVFGEATENQVEIRKRPNLDAEQIGYLQDGDRFKIINRTKNEMIIGDMNDYWYKIITTDGLYGWSYGFFIQTKK